MRPPLTTYNGMMLALAAQANKLTPRMAHAILHSAAATVPFPPPALLGKEAIAAAGEAGSAKGGSEQQSRGGHVRLLAV